MRVFVTGATGFVGSAVVRELRDAGHKVLGLVRSEAGASELAAAGIDVHHGSLDDLDSLRRGAASADGVVHTAFNHDFSKFKESCENDRHIIEALGAPLVGSDRPLIVTSALGVLPQGNLVTEDTAPTRGAKAHPRAATEEAAEGVAARGVRLSIMRLSPSVHGDGDRGFVPMLIGLAREKGVSAYIGEGQNRWPAVHRQDAARLYRLALETNSAATYHAVAERGVALRDIAAVIGRRLNLPVVSVSPADAAKHFGWFAHFAAMDVPASSERTRQSLGWQPQEAGLIADLDRLEYFR